MGRRGRAETESVSFLQVKRRPKSKQHQHLTHVPGVDSFASSRHRQRRLGSSTRWNCASFSAKTRSSLISPANRRTTFFASSSDCSSSTRSPRACCSRCSSGARISGPRASGAGSRFRTAGRSSSTSCGSRLDGRKTGVDFKAIDEKPVHFFFLIVAPPLEVSNQYLPVLGKIAQFSKEPDVPARLLELTEPKQFLALLEEKGV